MLSYILRRLFYAIPILLGVLVLTFSLFRVYQTPEKIAIAKVGPKATLTLYEDESYQDQKRSVSPGQKVADLHKNITSEGVESLQLTCAESSN